MDMHTAEAATDDVGRRALLRKIALGGAAAVGVAVRAPIQPRATASRCCRESTTAPIARRGS